MASSGPNYPGTGTFIDDPSDTNWTNASNITADDGSNATSATGGETDVLLGTAFGFAIDSGATIDGIVLEIDRGNTAGDPCKDQEVRLTTGGTPLGDNKADTASDWPTSVTTKTYGGAADTWGRTWTPAEVNASDFGARLLAARSSGKSTATAAVDFFRITVYYTAAGGGDPEGRLKGGKLIRGGLLRGGVL